MCRQFFFSLRIVKSYGREEKASGWRLECRAQIRRGLVTAHPPSEGGKQVSTGARSLPIFSAYQSTTGMHKSPLDLPRSGAAKDSFGGRVERKENIYN